MIGKGCYLGAAQGVGGSWGFPLGRSVQQDSFHGLRIEKKSASSVQTRDSSSLGLGLEPGRRQVEPPGKSHQVQDVCCVFHARTVLSMVCANWCARCDYSVIPDYFFGDSLNFPLPADTIIVPQARCIIVCPFSFVIFVFFFMRKT
jgi:hypothetical protein